MIETENKPAVEVRPAITNMSGFANADELEKVIPENTLAGNPEKKKRTYSRRPKAEDSEPEVNPLMADKKYRDSLERLNGFGGPTALKAVFKATQKPLDSEEEADVNAYFYVMSKRFAPLDPSQSIIGMVIMALLLIARLVYVRMEMAQSMWAQFTKLFEMKQKEEEIDEEEQIN